MALDFYVVGVILMCMNTMKKNFLAVFVASTILGGATFAQSLDELSDAKREEAALLSELANPDQIGWKIIEEKLRKLWGRSGSATADLMLKRGEDAMEAEDYVAAIDYFGAVTDHAPDFAEGWHSRATAFYAAGQLGPALHDVEMALTLNPNHFGALAGLGVILGDMNELDLAVEAYKRALKIHPHQEELQQGVNALNNILGRATL